MFTQKTLLISGIHPITQDWSSTTKPIVSNKDYHNPHLYLSGEIGNAAIQNWMEWKCGIQLYPLIPDQWYEILNIMYVKVIYKDLIN